jgi:hypothetical protein
MHVKARTGNGPSKNLVVPGSTTTKLRPEAVWEKMLDAVANLGSRRYWAQIAEVPGMKAQEKLLSSGLRGIQ